MIAKYALSAAALLQLATKANGQIVTGDGADDVSSDDWASVAESANYTQHATFKGRDVSSSYPGEEQDWSLHFSIKDDLEAGDDEQLTAGTLALYGPDDEVDFSEDWRLCVHVFNVKESSSGGFGSASGEDGCEGLVSPECVDDLRKNAVNNFGPGCPDYKTTPSCLRDVEESSRGSVVSINAENASDFIGNGTSFWRKVYGNHTVEQEEAEVLLSTANFGQVVVTVFGSASDSEESDPFGAATCVLPNTAEEGTVDPNEEGAASGSTAFAGWAALTAAAVYQLL